MNRNICIENEEIRMLFAKESDRELMHKMSIADESIVLSMFDTVEDFKSEEFEHADPEFFNGVEGKSKYLFIEYNNEIVGFFCHDYHPAKIDNMELHIWMASSKYTGKGIGTKVLNMMINYIKEKYNINTFLMRPWTKNIRAIKTYEKCGFKVMDDFKLENYFTDKEIEKYGNGAYCEEETANMILEL